MRYQVRVTGKCFYWTSFNQIPRTAMTVWIDSPYPIAKLRQMSIMMSAGRPHKTFEELQSRKPASPEGQSLKKPSNDSLLMVEALESSDDIGRRMTQ